MNWDLIIGVVIGYVACAVHTRLFIKRTLKEWRRDR